MEELLSQLHVVVIPEGVQCHLYDWSGKKIAKEHFVSAGDIHVLVRTGYGPVYGLLDETFKKPSFWENIKEYVTTLIHKPSQSESFIHALRSYIEEGEGRVDAILMAMTVDNKIGLLYVKEGDKPDLLSLR